MSKREEQIEIITQNNINDISSICGPTDEYIKGYTHGLKEGAKWADEHPNWISVEDELPKDMLQSLCLVVTKGVVAVGFYYNDYKQWFATGYCNLKPIEVTHWMPFPKFIKSKN